MTSEENAAVAPPVTRVLAVADSDSYLKWSAATLERLPAAWSRRQVVVSSPIVPSAAQAVAATGAAVEVLSLRRLARLVRQDPPDVLLLACTGPTVQVLTGLRAVAGPQRPVLVTGLPGISVPASSRAVDLRRGCDLLIVHSRRERIDIGRLVGPDGSAPVVAVTRLPFLLGNAPRGSRTPGHGGQVVFAAQAKVPPSRTDRAAILLALAEVEPRGSAVVKIRATPGEQQTHREDAPYPQLWAELVDAGRVPADAVGFRAGSMRSALATARSLVTVSSTAALEAIDEGVPVVVLADFGVGPEMINEVFRGSGCLGTLADVRAGRAFDADPVWARENYFHDDVDNDLVERLAVLVERRRVQGLPAPPRAAGPGRLRARVRLMLPQPLVRLARALVQKGGRQSVRPA